MRGQSGSAHPVAGLRHESARMGLKRLSAPGASSGEYPRDSAGRRGKAAPSRFRVPLWIGLGMPGDRVVVCTPMYRSVPRVHQVMIVDFEG